VKSCRVLPRLRGAAWADGHRRTHPVFSGHALSAGCGIVQGHGACQSLLGCADRIVGTQRHRLIFVALPLPFHEYVTPPAAVAVHADLDTLVLEEAPVSSAQIDPIGGATALSAFSHMEGGTTPEGRSRVGHEDSLSAWWARTSLVTHVRTT
jgi:hypothetical protein